MKKPYLFLLTSCLISLSLFSCKNKNIATLTKIDNSFEVKLIKKYYHYNKVTTTTLVNLTNSKNQELIKSYNKCLDEYTYYVDSYKPQWIAGDTYTQYFLTFINFSKKEIVLEYSQQYFYTCFFDDLSNQNIYIDNSKYKYTNLFNFEKEIVDMFECGDYQNTIEENTLS